MEPNFVKLELENFKSYREKTSFLWSQASVIFGLNGVGKSSVVDAIEFVFSFKRYQISVKQLRKDLSHSSEKSTWVKITLNMKGNEVIFERKVCLKKSTQTYMFNNTEVTLEKYRDYLANLNINYIANNFLVQQNSIENIATKSAKDRGEFFELMSGSIDMKKDYDKSKIEVNKCGLKITEIKKELKLLKNQKSSIGKSSKQIQKFNDLQEELLGVEQLYNLTLLYKKEEDIRDAIKSKEELEIKIKVSQKLKETTNIEMDTLKRKIMELENELKDFDEVLEIEKKKNFNYNSEVSQLNEELLSNKERITRVQTNLDKAKQQNESREKNIKDLQDQYNEIITKRNRLKSKSSLKSIPEDDQQNEEYQLLKLDSQKKLAKEIGLLDSLNRELETLKDKKDEFENIIISLEEKKKLDHLKYEKISSDLKKISEKIELLKSNQNNLTSKIDKAKKEIENLLKREIDLNNRLNVIEEQLSENKYNDIENKKTKKKREILEKLQNKFPGLVYDRLNIICDVNLFSRGPLDYQVAIAKILGNRINNIVVKDTNTAKMCIQYLREQYAGDRYSAVETFLPLDYIPKKKTDWSNPTRELIKSEPTAILAIDVIKEHVSPDIKRLLHHHIFEDIVICQTDEVASDLHKKHKLSCVSLEGTFHAKDGLISGGLATLIEKSKKLNEKAYMELKKEKEDIKTELRNLKIKIQEHHHCKMELESKLKSVQLQLEQYLLPLFQEISDKKEDMKKKLLELENQIIDHKNNSDINSLQNNIERLKQKYEEVELQKNAVEDHIFMNFCEHYNISDIRLFEKNNLQAYKENKNYIEEYNDHLNKIESEIKYQKNRDTKTEIHKLERNLEQLKNESDRIKNDLETLKNKINKKTEKLKKLKNKNKELRKNYEENKKSFAYEKAKLNAIENDLKDFNSDLTNKISKILNLQVEKHNILLECKFNEIDIPLLQGNIKQIVPISVANILDSETGSNSSSQPSTDNSHLRENDIQIDFSKLDCINVTNQLEELNKKRLFLKEKLKEISPDTQLTQNLEEINKKIKILKDDLNNKSVEFNKLTKRFTEVRAQRLTRFNKFFSSVEGTINSIFKRLYASDAAQAYIIAKNSSEPYLDGIDFSVLIPNKKFTPVDNLSGGEKTIAALSFLLTVFSVKPAPFLIFDEIDAALDLRNINRISEYFNNLKLSTQFIIISHHVDLFFKCADAGIGINISPLNHTSHVLHIPLQKYQKKTSQNKSLKNNMREKVVQFTTNTHK